MIFGKLLIFVVNFICHTEVVMVLMSTLCNEDLGQDVHERDVGQSAHGNQKSEAHPPVESFFAFQIVDHG